MSLIVIRLIFISHRLMSTLKCSLGSPDSVTPLGLTLEPMTFYFAVDI